MLLFYLIHHFKYKGISIERLTTIQSRKFLSSLPRLHSYNTNEYIFALQVSIKWIMIIIVIRIPFKKVQILHEYQSKFSLLVADPYFISLRDECNVK